MCIRDSFTTDQLADAGDLESSLFDGFCHHVDRCVSRHLGEYGSDDAGAGYTHADDAVCFTYAVEGASHKRVIFYLSLIHIWCRLSDGACRKTR